MSETFEEMVPRLWVNTHPGGNGDYASIQRLNKFARAVAKWQAQRDAEICLNLYAARGYHPFLRDGATRCAQAILDAAEKL